MGISNEKCHAGRGPGVAEGGRRTVQLETRGAALEPSADAVLFLTGTEASGDFHCAACGYGITVRALLPQCPMCRGIEWQESSATTSARRRL
jgi:hypothetical protein